jgi:orotate phosphoribosyltransferase
MSADLVSHLRRHALRTDGPFTLRSGALSDWYLDARMTTFDGGGAIAVAEAVLGRLLGEVTAVGGMTQGADPIAVATAVVGELNGRHLRAFSIRKAVKEHGTGGRLVGPVGRSDHVAVLEDTATTGETLLDAIAVLRDAGVSVSQVIVLVDRSGGAVAQALQTAALPYTALIDPADLGVSR